jgi:hypothetical protein
VADSGQGGVQKSMDEAPPEGAAEEADTPAPEPSEHEIGAAERSGPLVAAQLEEQKARLQALRLKDQQDAAKAERDTARTWLDEATAAVVEEELDTARRWLTQARAQLDLAERLVALTALKQRIERLEQELAAKRVELQATEQKLAERVEFLNALREFGK